MKWNSNKVFHLRNSKKARMGVKEIFMKDISTRRFIPTKHRRNMTIKLNDNFKSWIDKNKQALYKKRGY